MGNEGTFGYGAEIRPRIKENVFFFEISLYFDLPEKNCSCFKESQYLEEIFLGVSRHNHAD